MHLPTYIEQAGSVCAWRESAVQPFPSCRTGLLLDAKPHEGSREGHRSALYATTAAREMVEGRPAAADARIHGTARPRPPASNRAATANASRMVGRNPSSTAGAVAGH